MNPQVFYIPNHSSSDSRKCDLAQLQFVSTRPKFPNKQEFLRWSHDSKTTHAYYTMIEPEFPQFRASGQNAIRYAHGLVADYDGLADVIQAALPALKFGAGKAPTWVTTTFSGKARLIWAFERPVPTFNGDILSKFNSLMAKELKLKSILPGLDEGALIENPTTPFELGTDWRQPYGDTRIPHSVVMLALQEASNKAKWKVDGPEIPLAAVFAEVEKRWPNRWNGDFLEGARGVRFWDSKADNETGCTIRSMGVQAWTGEATFIAWSELLGREFVKQYQTDRIGGAIAGTFFDGKDYWRKDADGHWQNIDKEAVKRHINTLHGLSAESKHGQASEVSQALTTVDTTQRVDGAFPCLFMRDDIVRDGTAKYLNIARAKPIPNRGIKREWGDGFPWLALYLDGLLGDEQKQVFLSWLSYFYKNAIKHKPRKGHALFIAGPQSAGKTFLSQQVIGGLMGGFQEATSYVLGKSPYNEQLFHAPVWAVDDAVATADPSQHGSYSQIVKKIVANPSQEYHAKFKKAVTFRFNGRLVVTLNDDATSIAMLPQIEGSILDKIIILKAAAPGVSFDGADEKAAAELPFFADFLHNFVIPAWLLTRAEEVTRFGHDSWHNADLLAIAKESSTSAGLEEVLDVWRKYWFRTTDAQVWTGTMTELLIELQRMDEVKLLLPFVARGSRALGKGIEHIIQQGSAWIKKSRTSTARGITILRPADCVLNSERVAA